MNQVTDKYQKEVIIKTLEGEKKFTFRVLNVEEADEVFHESLLTIIKSFSALDLETVDASSILKAVSSISYSQKKKLGEALLKNVLLNDEPIGSFGDSKCEYFRDYPEEVYLCIFHAIKINFSGVFFRIIKALKGSPLQAKMENFQATLQKASE